MRQCAEDKWDFRLVPRTAFSCNRGIPLKLVDCPTMGTAPDRFHLRTAAVPRVSCNLGAGRSRERVFVTKISLLKSVIGHGLGCKLAEVVVDDPHHVCAAVTTSFFTRIAARDHWDIQFTAILINKRGVLRRHISIHDWPQKCAFSAEFHRSILKLIVWQRA